MQFGKFEEIQKKGYHAAMDILENWDEEGKLPSAYIAGKDVPLRGKKKGQSARRNSI
jgi:lysophospholipid hydrolase